MSREKRAGLLILAVALLFGISVLQQPIDRLRPQFREENILGDKGETPLVLQLSAQFLGGAMLGLREAVASALWIRADEFFHSGNYETIIPLVRLVTWLDPHQTEVYSTGAWHLDYNFVDSLQRSDRRYIPPAIELMQEGCKNNPRDYDLFFDLGWMHYYQKIKDYNGAAKWLEIATTKAAKDPNTGVVVKRPLFVRRMLAHAYERAGDLDKAEKVWNDSLAEAIKYSADAEKADPKDTSYVTEIEVTQKNLGLMLLRRAWRYGDLGAYERGLRVMDGLTRKDPDLVSALARAKSQYAVLKAAGKAKPDCLPLIDPKFEITWKKLRPKVLMLQGKLAMIPADDYKDMLSECFTKWYTINQGMPLKRQVQWRDGCRLRIMLADADYDYKTLKMPETFSWDVDMTQTLMMDDVMARNGVFQTVIDMSKDPSMYPFAKDKYRLLIWSSPADFPDFMQDRVGWKGEGLMDKPYIDKNMVPGYKVIRKEFILTRRDIM